VISDRKWAGFVTGALGDPARIGTPVTRRSSSVEHPNPYKSRPYAKETLLALRLPSSPSNGPGFARSSPWASTGDGEAK
jgi:hypothetical protein